MPISKRLLEQLIERGKINISPYNSDQLYDNGYSLRIDSQITKYNVNSDAYLPTTSSLETQDSITYEIPEDIGVILEPRRIYRVELIETITSDDYSIQIVPMKNLSTYGLSVNISGNVDYNPPGKMYITLTSIQPVTIYRNQELAMAYFTSAEGDGVPTGGIIMWSGSEVPNGWLLCDGKEGTPDLRDRFVLGWGSRSIGDVGGEERHTLTVDEMPSHTHDAGSLTARGATGGGGGLEASGAVPASVSVTGNTGSTGGDASHNNMPPYYVLAFIMKT